MIDPASGDLLDKFADHAATLDSPVPLFQRGMQTQPQLSDSLQSRDMSKTRSMCVELLSDTGVQRSVPVRLAGIMRLSFRHSVYGSQVEEVFSVRRDGFELSQLRYGEARLVEFYGHENSQHAAGVWIVTPRPTLLPFLNLNISSDAAMSLHFGHPYDANQFAIQPGSALRLTVASCKSSAHG
jgi:hypothetical protein